MAIKLTAESFLEIVKRSRLVPQDQLQRVLAEARSAGVDAEDSRFIAGTLVEKTGLTRWQADKLLQGKHKGFFLGKYRLLSLLGKGGMGSVYLAEHTLMRRRCAIKVLPAKRVNDTSYLGRFHREAQAVAALDHANIVRAYDVDKEDEGDTEIHFLVMEYVNGRSLLEIVLKDGPMDFVQAADFVRQAADGLAHAHKAGMVHRDIKPGNLLVDQKMVVKILDLGLARFFGGPEGEEEESLTVAHDEKVLGTADYLAPEQALDSHTVDARADIYSLGCTAYFMLTGHPPFTEGTLAQRLMAHQTKEPPPLEEKRDGIPPDLLAIIKRMMAKSLDERYQSANDVNDALKEWLLQNADEDWRMRNSAIIGSDSSTIRGRAGSSLKSSRAAATGEDSQAGNGAETAAALTVAETVPLKAPAGEDGELATFLSNLDAPAPPPVDPPPDKPLAETSTSGSGSQVNRKPASGLHDAEAAVVPAPPPPVQSAVAPPAPADSEPVDPLPVAAPAKVATPAKAAAAVAPVAVPVAAPVVEVTAPDDSVPAAAAVQPAVAEPDAPAQFEERSYARRTKRRRRTAPSAGLLKSKPVRLGLMAAAGAVLLGAVIFAGVSLFSGDEDKPKRKSAARQSQEGNSQTTASKTPKKQAKRLSKIEVGPASEYKTIGAALDYARKNYEPRSLRSKFVIQVAGGQTYAERIELDGSFPEGVRIEAQEGTRPVLAPSAGGPVIKLDGVQRFSLQGFDLNAEGKETAVELSGPLNACRLADLKLTGFTKTGLLSKGAVGVSFSDQGIHLDKLEFRAGNGEAVGVRLQQGASDTSELYLSDCRFLGPLSVGILLQNGPTYISVRRSVFFELGTGIKFDGSNMRLFYISIGNCTFHKLDRGIVFTDMPSTDSHNLMIARNLFNEVKGLETVVEKGFDLKKMYSMFSAAGNATGWNVSTRPATTNPAEGEFNVFTANGQQGAKVDFVSTDAGEERFLAPPAGADWAKGLPADSQNDLEPYVGAVGP